MDFRISLLMKKPTEEELNLFAFLLPFKMDVWLSTIAAVSIQSVNVRKCIERPNMSSSGSR